MVWRAVCASAAVLLLGSGSGCGDDDGAGRPAADPATSASTSTSSTAVVEPVGGLLATIGTNRLFEPNRGFGLGLENTGAEAVVVRSVQLDTDLFAQVPAAEREVVLPPGGRRLVLPLPYGEARCDGGSDAALGAVVVVEGGEELRVPAVEDHPGAIGRLHGRECAAADVRGRVDLRFGDSWAREGVTLTGELLLDQLHEGPPVVVDDAAGNVILTLRFPTDDTPVLAVSDDERSDRIEVTISADRCDPHAVAEFKRPYVFLTWVAVGDAPTVPVELVATGPTREAVAELIATC